MGGGGGGLISYDALAFGHNHEGALGEGTTDQQVHAETSL
jgi:hypothetical protein